MSDMAAGVWLHRWLRGLGGVLFVFFGCVFFVVAMVVGSVCLWVWRLLVGSELKV